MEKDCPLCNAVRETYRVVYETETTYSMIPLHPLRDGHVMVLPKRHSTMENLKTKELEELRNQVCILMKKILLLHPESPPLVVTDDTTTHASIPNHFHYHLVPTEVNIRKLLSSYDPTIPEKKEAGREVLEKMAKRLRS